MRVSIIKRKKIKNMILPSTIVGNYWISDTDSNGIMRNLISIEADNNKWKLISNKEVYIKNGDSNLPYIFLEPNHFYVIRNDAEQNDILIYCSNDLNEYLYYDITAELDNGITIGGTEDNFICYQGLNSLFTIKRENNQIFISAYDDDSSVYVNDVRVNKVKELNFGDIIFISGLKIVLLAEQGHTKLTVYLCLERKETVTIKKIPITRLKPENIEFNESSEEFEYPLYDEKEYFHKKPRFISNIKPLEFNVDAPPAKSDEGNSSFLLTIGPMITMSMTSLVSGYTAISGLMSGETTIQRALPSLIICGAMFASIFIWPLFTRMYEKRARAKNEAKRQEKYHAYIEEKKKMIADAIVEQSRILKQNLPSTKETAEIILNKYVTLWQRRIEDSDYLKVNLGIGSCPMAINIKYPEDHFSMVEDNLKEMVSNLGNEPKTLIDVPIAFSFVENYISGLVGEEQLSGEYMRRILTQILAFHSYDDLKIIIFTDEENEYQWKFLKSIPHLYTNDKSLRFFATNNDEYKEICYYLDQVYNFRKENADKGENNLENIDQTFLIITDSFKKIRDFDIIKSILDNKKYLGFSLFILDQKVTNLPDQVNNFIELNGTEGSLCNNSNIENKINFKLELDGVINYEAISRTLANIPIEFSNNDEGQLPNKLGFLEMYDVGKIEQLNAPLRWQNSNPMLNLSVPVGVGKNGEKINIDLHEKYHGPHGLIAGMTGSGKSEFIITYILSMAINFHPYEVQFILIDYKGGGLAGAFENNSTGLKLPHLVGTITNLDANEIKRSLASIESELKRRQALFNKAREVSGESTIDIYKYQKMYREKIVDEPMSHLFIISDEFAELKNQQPEFMDQLISTARIGRSLGVHLILATQKPSGVVDPQIWSNTRFRICLKVQDKADSNEIIKSPDAAYLKQTGRFYFQVGFNEVFVLGQAAWAGENYIPTEKVNKVLDTSINFINNIGYPIKTMETREKKEQLTPNQGEELINIVKYLGDLAKAQNIKCRPLWLAKMPEVIKITDLATKYNYQKENFVLNPIIGEYDVPSRQEQKLLTLPLTEEGNALIYGATGSGKENFLTTLLYSTMLYHDAQEVNFYIIDFGAETLKMFKDSPLIGDILTSSDEEKINNLFKMLDQIINERKILFADYNGNISTYCKNSGQTVPNIVVILNNYEAFQETYDDLEEKLNILTRDCTKYGIYFVITVNTPNGLRFKLKQNFALIYALQQNNEDDFISILGNVHKNYPSKIFGRGLVKIDDIYEFQTALVNETENIREEVKNKCLEWQKNASVKARSIPILPEKVGYEDIASMYNQNNEIIIGIDKNDLIPVGYDFAKNYATLISGLDITNIDQFLNPLINQIIALQKENLYVLNAADINIDERYRQFYQYYDNDFNAVFTQILDFLTNKKEEFQQNNYAKDTFANIKPLSLLIIGLEEFKRKLSEENKNKFNDFLTLGKDLNLINFVLIDSIDNIKKVEFEPWYKEIINNTNGIWLGNGIEDQFTIKVSQRIEEMHEEVPYNFCFVIKRGKAEYVKYVESFDLNIK